MPPHRPSNRSQLYKELENKRLWKAVNKGISDLVENQDLKEITHREYIVGYLCKVLTRRKKKLFSK